MHGFHDDTQDYLGKARPIPQIDRLEIWARGRRMARVFLKREESFADLRRRAELLARSYSGEVIDA